MTILSMNVINNEIYWDANATTPCFNEPSNVVSNFDYWGNPSSLHKLGRISTNLLEESRLEIEKYFKKQAFKAIFTSSATEANGIVLNTAKEKLTEDNKGEIWISANEHSSIINWVPFLTSKKLPIRMIPVDKNGIIDFEYISKHLHRKPSIFFLQGANSETGVIQPIKQVSEICNLNGIWLHCDAVQLPGKSNMDYLEWDVDTMVFSSHKIYADKGTGLLLTKRKLHPFYYGGNQESGIRPGTENLKSIISFKKSWDWIHSTEIQAKVLNVEKLRNSFEKQLKQIFKEKLHIFGETSDRITNTSNIAFAGVDNQHLFSQLDQNNLYVSIGSACNSGTWEPSKILLNMGVDHNIAKSAIRVSFLLTASQSEVDAGLAIIEKVLFMKN